MKKLFLALMCVAAVMMIVSCGGNNKGGKAAEGEDAEQTSEAVTSSETVSETVAAKQEQKTEPKKWYESDFTITEKMYVGPACVSRTYARKGNVLVATTDDSSLTNLFEFTDSTRTRYLISNNNRTYKKMDVKSGYDSMEDGIFKYLKSQMSETVFGKKLKKDDEGTTVKDTTVFGRPAYIITKEAVEKNAVAEAWGKTIMHIDKENGLSYYKWTIMKVNGDVISEGKAFEVTDFSAEPTYEGLIVSLDGLTEL